MKKIKSFENFNESLGKFSAYMNSLIKRGGKLASDVWDATKVEGEETKIAVGILSRMVKGEEVSEKEKSFLTSKSEKSLCVGAKLKRKCVMWFSVFFLPSSFHKITV